MTLGTNDGIDHRHWIRTRWVRRRYFVQDNYIRPVPGGVMEAYDPFEGYSHEEHPLAGRSSYLQLLDVNLDDEREIEEWTSRWGLLGLFQDRLVQARRFIRTDKGWDAVVEWGSTATVATVLPGLVSSARAPEPGASKVLLASDPLGEIIERPLEEYFGTYFPFLPPDQAVPSLASSQIWDFLSEPLGDFRTAVHNLKSTVELATTGLTSLDDQQDGEFQRWMHLMRLQFSINPRVQRVYRAVSPGVDDTLMPVWVFPSLLSALYTMLLQDLTGGRLLECASPGCGRPFVPGRSDQRYCSLRCKNVVLQRRRRGRQTQDPSV